MNSSIAGRIEAIEIKNPELAGHLKIARRTLTSDPHTAVTKCRIALEKILFQVYIRELGKQPSKSMVGNLLSDKEFNNKIPNRVRARMNLVREIGNLGAHGGEITREDAKLAFGEIINVIEWFILTYDLFILQSIEGASSYEMLPQLLEKYKTNVRPTITSVRFMQSKNRCSLEITTVSEMAGYLRDEQITRTDLGFIANSDVDDLFFDPRNKITENVNKFIHEFDEYSICMCTELFTDEAAQSINDSLSRK